MTLLETPWAPVSFATSEHADGGDGTPAPMLVWRFPEPVRTIASGMLGGGIRSALWVVNAHVRLDYARTDPDEHLRQIARDAGLDPEGGAGLLTAAKLERVATAQDGEVRCDATVGVSYPTWAAAADGEALPETRWRPGTINLVCQVPVPLSDAALVGAAITATEAKTQALIEGGAPGTGTASDALVVCCPPAPDPHTVPFAGPRSVWGARLARAVHRAVAEGLARYTQG